jgi:hypothetical protein
LKSPVTDEHRGARHDAAIAIEQRDEQGVIKVTVRQPAVADTK